MLYCTAAAYMVLAPSYYNTMRPKHSISQGSFRIFPPLYNELQIETAEYVAHSTSMSTGKGEFGLCIVPVRVVGQSIHKEANSRGALDCGQS